jgi:phage terminase large subunit-like protein
MTTDTLPRPLSVPAAARRILGSEQPRIVTPPLRRLTRRTSVGFADADYSIDPLGRPLRGWQRDAIIRAGELRKGGGLRFRYVFIIVARQNGKTEIPVISGARWLFERDRPGLMLGTSTKIEYAYESWKKIVTLVEGNPYFDDLRDMPPYRWKRERAAEQELWTLAGGRYKIAAANRAGGRSLTIGRLVLDELREHDSYDAWAASTPATIAVADAQVWALSNAGDATSVVLNDKRAANVVEGDDGIERAIDDPDTDTLWLEYSSPRSADPLDPHALAAANPMMNRPGGIDGATLWRTARDAVNVGGEALTTFKTEHMCIGVKLMDPAINAEAWRRTRGSGDLAGARSRVAVVVEVAPDLSHVAAYASAIMPDGRARIDFIDAWSGADAVTQAERALPGVLGRVRSGGSRPVRPPRSRPRFARRGRSPAVSTSRSWPTCRPCAWDSLPP